MHALRNPVLIKQQRGAVFLVMIVILTVGLIATLVAAFSKVTLQTARNEKSADMLAQTKEEVIGYMLKGGTSTLGWMMMPDVLNVPSATEKSPTDNSLTSNYDGEWESNCFDSTKPTATPPYTPLTGNNTNKRCFGRLPWKSLGMSISNPSENDPTGFMPWYAFSRNLITATTPVNSELLNTNTYPWLKVYDMNGTLLSDRVAFVIIIPGTALPNQNRPASPNLAGPDQYLDSISLPAGCSPSGTPCTTTYRNYDLTETFVTGDEHRWMSDPITGKQIEDPTYQFNDKLLYVTIDELMPLIEKRIAREVKACLDDYAVGTAMSPNPNHRYPWAAPISDITAYPSRPGTYNVLFGRLAEIPNVNTTSGGTPPTGTLLSKINAVQTALTAYINGTGTLGNLQSKGDALKDYAALIGQAPTDPARAAGITADNCTGMSCTATLQSQLTTALGGGAPDSTMPTSWATIPSCNQLIFTSSYWPDWRDLVFYQVAEGYRPGGGAFTPLHISGSGNTVADSNTYRAAVVVAGKMLAGQTPRTQTNPPTTYLETSGGNSNAHQSAAGATPSVNFMTYKPSDATNYSTVNDLVLCVDGKDPTNPNSLCQ